MLQKHKSRLSYLMDIFGITAKELAAAVHVDHSLVSKWRNKTRVLNPKSCHPENIAAYFVALDSQLKLNIITELLQKEFPDTDHQKYTAETKTQLLKLWLLERNGHTGYGDRPFTDRAGGTYSCQIFKGNKGRRNASQRFMEIALSLPAVQDILLYSESPQVSWHAEDKLFYEKWKENYLKILQQGSRITLIHSLDRETRSLLNILLEWLPMELTGNMHSYYFSKYTDSPFKFTVMVIREKAALFSVTVPDSGKDIYTYLFADPVTVREGELLYSSLLANCNLIYRHYRETERDALLHMLTDSQQTPGNSYWFTTAPMFCILPEASLYEILSFDNLCSPSVPQYFRQYKKMQQLFIRSLQNHKCRVILSEPVEEAYRPDFLRQQSAALTRLYRSSFRQSILHLLHLLTAYPNFEIALINNLPVAEPPEICLYTKENTLVMANSQLPDKTEPFTILSREQNVVNAYFVHFETYWHSIPPINRDREWVGEKFRNLLHNLAIDI